MKAIVPALRRHANSVRPNWVASGSGTRPTRGPARCRADAAAGRDRPSVGDVTLGDVFDEATSPLDPELVKGILELIAELGEAGMTMVVVTHEMGFARSTSDAVVYMDHGLVVESGPPEQIFEATATDRLGRFLLQVL